MNILVVEDDELLAVGLKSALLKNGYAVMHAPDGNFALAALNSSDFDLVILDLGLPDMDGLDVLKGLRRARSTSPVLVLTARDGVEQQVAGLNAGADDYMEKPFDLRELEARIKALLRRSQTGVADRRELGHLSLDPFQRIVSLHNKLLELPAREYEILEALVLKAPRLVSKQRLAQRLALDGEAVGDNAVEVYVHRLRRKLCESNVSICTARGSGYFIELKE